MEALGNISTQLSSMQQRLSSLTSTVDQLTSQTAKLSKRLVSLEDKALIEAPPNKKRRLDVPRDLSVSHTT